MFCKWCGADIAKGSMKCARCGKDVPATSDCGGFYDLIPNAKGKIPSGSTRPTEPAEPTLNGNRKKEAKRKGDKLPFIVSCVCFVVVIALLSVLVARVGKLYSAFSGNAVLEEQEVSVFVSIEAAKENVSVKSTASADDVALAIVDKVAFDKNKDSVSNIAFDLGKEEDCITLSVSGASNEKTGTLVIDLAVDDSVFAKAEGDEEYQWAYRSKSNADWEALDKNAFSVSEDGKTLTCAAKFNGELQLTYTRNNEEGGSLTVVVSGITVIDD